MTQQANDTKVHYLHAGKQGKRVVLLADFKVTENTGSWLKHELDKLGYQVTMLGIQDYNEKDDTTNFGKLKIWYKYFRLAGSGIREANSSDIIITDNFVIGAITAFLSSIKNRSRKIIALNLIAHRKGLMNKVLRKVVYNRAFRYKGFRFSVNDKELIGAYAKEFRFPEERVFVLHDAVSSRYEQAEFTGDGQYVFTGGDAFRDWNGFIACASALPSIQFVGVARQKHFPVEKKLPANVEMHFDTSSDEFYRLLKRSKLVFLPLKSLAPCGLIVMMRAALLSKPVIITETPSTKNYIENDFSGKLVKLNDISDMKNAIDGLYHSEEKGKLFAGNLKENLLTNYTTEKNALIIDKIISTAFVN